MSGRIYVYRIATDHDRGIVSVVDVKIIYENDQCITTQLSIRKEWINKIDVFKEVKKYFKGDLILC